METLFSASHLIAWIFQLPVQNKSQVVFDILVVELKIIRLMMQG